VLVGYPALGGRSSDQVRSVKDISDSHSWGVEAEDYLCPSTRAEVEVSQLSIDGHDQNPSTYFEQYSTD
jgi:hypothetical protein